MPFRAKFKKALGGGNPSSDDSEVPNKSFLNKTSAHRPLTKSELKAWPKNVYKPGEVMPRPKYRGPWNQAHQDKLSAFSFGSSSRRRSSATVRTGSEYSPMGSKLPSRGQSRRNSSISWSSLTGRKRPPLESREASGFGHEDRVDENGEADDDVGNGMFRFQFTSLRLCSNVETNLRPFRLMEELTSGVFCSGLVTTTNGRTPSTPPSARTDRFGRRGYG